ncbi:MAG: acylphosphatase [Methanothrix sp.]|jgi:acylphosphatase|nr:acylphosphatase [Methanothrix sp.]
MKLKIKIIGPKVHDVGYRYFLLGIAMSNRIRMFEAHNTKSSECEEVVVFADGDEAAIKAFCNQIETERPARSEVSNIVFDDFEGEVMKIGEYAQFCATVQLNKAIPVLLDLRDSMHEVRKNTAVTPQILNEIKAVRKTTDATFEEIKGLREDIQPGYGMTLRQVQADVRAIKERLGMQ